MGRLCPHHHSEPNGGKIRFFGRDVTIETDKALKWKFHARPRSVPQSYESRMGISADTEGEGEEDEEAAESPEDASDDQRIIIKKEGREGAARRY